MLRQSTGFRFGGPLTPVVKKLMIINGAVFLIQQLAGLFWPGLLEHLFGLNHQGLVREYWIWQIFTYMFLHGGWLHIIFNLFGMWMFAGELESLWGGRRFLQYYIFSGVGAGVFIALMNYIVSIKFPAYAALPYVPTTIGASGAIYGILLAYGLTWPNREVLLYFLFPIKMKYLVLIFGLIEFFGTLSGASGEGGNVSHVGHLGGLLSGFLLLVAQRKGASRSATRKDGKNFFRDPLKKYRLIRKQRQIRRRIEAKRIIDTLLEKIARQGMSSLSPRERKQLDWARRHYYREDSETIH